MHLFIHPGIVRNLKIATEKWSLCRAHVYWDISQIAHKCFLWVYFLSFIT